MKFYCPHTEDYRTGTTGEHPCPECCPMRNSVICPLRETIDTSEMGGSDFLGYPLEYQLDEEVLDYVKKE